MWIINNIVYFSAPFYKITVPTVDTIRYECVVTTLLNAGCLGLLTGPVGTGKTSTAQSVTATLDPMHYTILSVNMSAQVNTYQFFVNQYFSFEVIFNNFFFTDHF